jgi:hypothetical protein
MRSRFRPLLCLFLLLCFAASGFAEYRTVEIESLRIIVDTDWPGQGTPGYFPIRLDITNLGDDREIRIVGAAQRFFDFFRRRSTTAPSLFGPSSNMGSSTFSQTLPLKRGDRKTFTLAVPVMADNENLSIRIFENGRPLEGFISHAQMRSGHQASEAAVLFVADPSSAQGIDAGTWARPVPPAARPRYAGYGGSMPATGRSAPKLDFVLDPDRLPSNWLGFTSLRAVAIAPAEWARLTPQQQQALRTWVAGGGDLMIIDGPLDTVLPADARPAGYRTANEAFNNYYFGHIHLVTSSEIREKGLPDVMARTDIASPYADWTLPANRATDWGQIGSKGFRLPIQGVGGVPTKAYLSMLVVFSLVIGPLNYFYLWRKRQQVLLVLTVPLISLLFIGILATYAYLGEGLAIRGRAATFTVLDQTTKQAATRASVSLYAGGIAPSGGLTFPSQFGIFPLGTDGAGLRGQTELDFTDSQRFSNGMLQARSPSNFEEITFGPARERLSIEHSGNMWNVVNGLGADISQLYYRANGQMFVLNGTLRAGQKGSLRSGEIRGPEVYADAVNSASSLSSSKFQMLVDQQPNGTYLAVLDKSPFWDSGVEKLEERSSLHLVLGYLDGLP